MVVTAVIGKDHGIGVENLQGSGMIAGETARAYRDTFTLSYISGRCVGIGAYLVRLGQRTIQKSRDAPIILTGHTALNKLMGKEVYASNAQLGGVRIMHTNGVSHLVCDNDLEGADRILEWLSFVPLRRGGPLPVCRVLLFEREYIVTQKTDNNNNTGTEKRTRPSGTKGGIRTIEGALRPSISPRRTSTTTERKTRIFKWIFRSKLCRGDSCRLGQDCRHSKSSTRWYSDRCDRFRVPYRSDDSSS